MAIVILYGTTIDTYKVTDELIKLSLQIYTENLLKFFDWYVRFGGDSPTKPLPLSRIDRVKSCLSTSYNYCKNIIFTLGYKCWLANNLIQWPRQYYTIKRKRWIFIRQFGTIFFWKWHYCLDWRKLQETCRYVVLVGLGHTGCQFFSLLLTTDTKTVNAIWYFFSPLNTFTPPSIPSEQKYNSFMVSLVFLSVVCGEKVILGRFFHNWRQLYASKPKMIWKYFMF